jgi:hypothetical protein
MDKPPPHCECMNCYFLRSPGDNYVMCHKGEQIQKQWMEYYKIKRALSNVPPEVFATSREEHKAKKREREREKQRERERERARIVREKEDRFYNFIFYASLLYLIVLKIEMGYESP